MKNLRNTFQWAVMGREGGMSGVPVVGGMPEFTANNSCPKRVVFKR